MSYFARTDYVLPLEDAFGRLRVSQPATLFDSKLLYDADTYNWDDQQVSGTATSTYNTNQSSVTLATAATTGVRVRQTKQRFNYQPGKSQLIFLTGILGTATANVTQRCGYFDDNNGLFFELVSTGIGVVRRTFTSGSAVDNRVAQASWNLDKLDGTGASGFTLDLTKTNIFVIDFEWLGVGSVRFGFVINGTLVYVHQINNANTLTLVYMQTPNLPLRWELRTTSNATASVTAICGTVMSEGGLQEVGKLVSISRGSTGLTTNNDANLYPLLAFRLASTRLSAAVLLSDFNVACNSTSTYRWELVLNPTISGTALSFSAVTGSSLEADVARTNATTYTGGTVLLSGYSQSTNDGNLVVPLSSSRLLGSTIAGVADIVVLGIQRVAGTSETFFASINFREL